MRFLFKRIAGPSITSRIWKMRNIAALHVPETVKYQKIRFTNSSDCDSGYSCLNCNEARQVCSLSNDLACALSLNFHLRPELANTFVSRTGF